MRRVLLQLVLIGLLVGCAPVSPPVAPTGTRPETAATGSPLPTVPPSPVRVSPSSSLLSPTAPDTPESPAFRPFAFAVTADTRLYAGPGIYDTPQYFRGACEAIATACGQVRSEAEYHACSKVRSEAEYHVCSKVRSEAEYRFSEMECRFMLSPGDVDPPAGVLWTITRTLGAGFPWYPAVGNHEVETPEDMDWLRQYGATLTAPDGTPVRPGPPGCPTTTYAFDYGNAHFVVLNLYCDAAGDAVTDGDVPDHLYSWLAADLAATDRPHIFVFGHEPAYPQPDADTGRERHMEDSLNAHPARRDRFWNLMRERGVRAYICGHTHNYSAVQVDGLWQLDAGHARGIGDTGAPSTFILVRVDGPLVVFETYRNYTGSAYTLAYTGTLAAPVFLYLPSVQNAAP